MTEDSKDSMDHSFANEDEPEFLASHTEDNFEDVSVQNGFRENEGKHNLLVWRKKSVWIISSEEIKIPDDINDDRDDPDYCVDADDVNNDDGDEDDDDDEDGDRDDLLNAFKTEDGITNQPENGSRPKRRYKLKQTKLKYV